MVEAEEVRRRGRATISWECSCSTIADSVMSQLEESEGRENENFAQVEREGRMKRKRVVVSDTLSNHFPGFSFQTSAGSCGVGSVAY